MFVRPSHEKSANLGTSSAVIGTISETSETATSQPRARAGSRAIANPAHEATSRVSGQGEGDDERRVERVPREVDELECALVVLERGLPRDELRRAGRGEAGAAKRAGDHEDERKQEERGDDDSGDDSESVVGVNG